jgi:hypothetical protein
MKKSLGMKVCFHGEVHVGGWRATEGGEQIIERIVSEIYK